jgi:hypothetical protein
VLKELTELKDRGVSLAVAPRPAYATPEREAGSTNKDRNQIGAGGNPPGRHPERLVRVAAERRVERFLADFGVPRGRRRELVVQSCVARATEEWREHPGRDLGALAFAQAEETLAQWFRAVLGAETIAQNPPLLVGRAAVEICEAAGSWPGTLSTCDRLPPAASEALRRAGVSATPSEMQGTMRPQVLEPWSVKDLAASLGTIALRLARGISGGTAATS